MGKRKHKPLKSMFVKSMFVKGMFVKDMFVKDMFAKDKIPLESKIYFSVEEHANRLYDLRMTKST